MKILPSQYAIDIVKPVTTLCTCWKITLRDNTVLGFTSFNRDIKFIEDNIVYKAKTGFSPSAIASSSAFNVDNLEITGILDDFSITEADLNSGRYDFSSVEVFRLNWMDKPYSYLKCEKISKGVMGELKIDNNQYNAEVRSLTQFLQFNVGDLYAPACTHEFGDSNCTVDVTQYTFSSVVTSIYNNRLIGCALTQPANFFNEGKVIFTSGLNITLESEIKHFLQNGSGTVELQLPANYTISIGDTFNIIKGCDKLMTTCISYDNAKNHGGFPDLPGTDIGQGSAVT